jgi:hypothetical protein
LLKIGDASIDETDSATRAAHKKKRFVIDRPIATGYDPSDGCVNDEG